MLHLRLGKLLHLALNFITITVGITFSVSFCVTFTVGITFSVIITSSGDTALPRGLAENSNFPLNQLSEN